MTIYKDLYDTEWIYQKLNVHAKDEAVHQPLRRLPSTK